MKKHLAGLLLLALLVGATLLSLVNARLGLALEAVPLCGLAIVYGFPGALLGAGYAYLLWLVALSAEGRVFFVPYWQWILLLAVVLCSAWISVQRERHRHLARLQRRLLEGMRDGVILTDDQLQPLVINSASINLLALPDASDARRQALSNLGLTAQWESCRAQPAQGATTREYTVDARVLQVTATPVVEHETFAGIVTTIVDYTDERRLTAMREEFLAFISHELRNPLTVVHGFTELLLSRPIPTELANFMPPVHRSIRRLLRLIRDILQLSTLESGSFQLVRQPVLLNEMLANLIETLRPAAEAVEVTLTHDPPGEPLAGHFDADRLEQVFVNLVENALKYTPPGGGVSVRLARDGDTALVEVRDQGPGIAAEELEGIFDKYVQTAAGRALRQGAGLGLTICRQMVELHQGRVWATSTRGAGSSFWVMLPLAATYLPTDTDVPIATETAPE